MKFRWWWLAAVVVAVAMIAGGVQAGQWEVVKRWAETLCTGCIGLY